MGSNEAYLDSLLAALNGEQNKEAEPIVSGTEITEESRGVEPEVIESEEVEFEEVVSLEVEVEPETEETTETEEELIEPEEEVIEITPISDDPNKALGADEIAALFAQANVDMETGDAVEVEEEPEAEETIEITPVSDDPNKALGADEIAALFAQANVDMETGDVAEAEEEPEAEETIEIIPISDDPNKALGADEIAALFAQANVDMETGDAVEVEEEPEAEETIEITPISDDPNKALGADEIAALFAQANIDMETGNAAEVDEGAESLSLDDMLAQMTEEDERIEENKVETPYEEIQEEIEIDMDDPEAVELLLGLGERPDWSAQKSKEDDVDDEDLLAVMGEENPDLEEINSLLNKLDNNELVGDGIEEGVLVDFNESEYDGETDPWLDELLGSGEEKKKKRKVKKERKKFSLFGKKKKEQEEEISEDAFVPTMGEDEAMPDSEEVTDILQAFAEDNADIPFDLFAENDGEEAADLDLIALVEADNKKQGKKSEKNKGFFAKMLDVLTEEISEDEEEVIKEKKAKKSKKGKKKPVTDAEDNEGILEELDAEGDGKKGKKAKKAKKDKKAKKEKKAPKQMDDASLLDMVQDAKKLPMKMVVRIFALCLSVMALLLLITHFIPKIWSLADARNAFYKQDYETTYQEMSGKELSESDQRLFEKAKMVLQLNHKVEAYANYKEMNMPVEALDSLLSGYLLWQELGEKIVEYDAVTETDEAKNAILNALSADYQISEEEAQQINSLGNYEYTLRLEEITGSLSRKNSSFYSETEIVEEAETEESVQEETQEQKPTEDVLPEEEVQ